VNKLNIILLVIAVLGSGLMAGLFSSFSNFIMKSLAMISSASGISAMQSINIVIVRPAFILVFFGTGVLSLLALVVGWQELNTMARIFGSMGATMYILGGVGVTMVFNVPLNNSLAVVEAGSGAGEKMWQIYLVKWVFWNHVRSLATMLSTLCLVLAVYYAG